MKQKSIVALLFAVMIACSVNAQSFLPFSDQYRGPSMVQFANGEQQEILVLTTVLKKKRYLRKINYRIPDERGIKNASVDELQSFSMKATDMGKALRMYRESGSGMARTIAASTNWEAVIKQDSIYYHHVNIDPKGEEILMAQVINPGFDNKMKVFYGTKKVRYIIQDEEGKSHFVTNQNYANEIFPLIYKSCEKLMALPDEKRRIAFIAEHVLVYDQECN